MYDFDDTIKATSKHQRDRRMRSAPSYMREDQRARRQQKHNRQERLQRQRDREQFE